MSICSECMSLKWCSQIQVWSAERGVGLACPLALGLTCHFCVLGCAGDTLCHVLLGEMHDHLGALRISELFDLIVDFPEVRSHPHHHRHPSPSITIAIMHNTTTAAAASTAAAQARSRHSRSRSACDSCRAE